MERPPIYQDARLLPNPNDNPIQRLAKVVEANPDREFTPEKVYSRSTSYLHSRSIRHKIRSISRENRKYKNTPLEDLAEKMNKLDLKKASKEKLDTALPEVFAATSKAMQETLGMTPFDTQIKAGIALHDGKVVEMATGEGKTLAIGLAAALNGLSGEGVHVITATNTLAKRDASFLGAVYHKLGLTTSVILEARDGSGEKIQYIYDPTVPGEDPDYPHLRRATRKEAYEADITYGIGKAFIFDNLEDEMVFNSEDKVQRELNFAIVDEIDNTLVDEAATPNIVTEPITNFTDTQIKEVENLIKRLNLQPNKYEGEGKNKKLVSGDFDFLNEFADTGAAISLNDKTYDKINSLVNFQYINEDGTTFDPDEIFKKTGKKPDLFADPRNNELIQRINASLKAHYLFKRGIHYFVEDDKIILIDRVTGVRTPDKHFEDMIHQAIQAKEGVPITQDTEVVNSTQTQTYFRKYKRLSGPTGSAASSAKTFKRIYNMDIVTIPQRITSKREYKGTKGIFESKEDVHEIDPTTGDEVIYKTKFTSAIENSLKRRETGQPVLLYASNIEDADRLKEIMLPYLDNEFVKNNKGELVLYQPQVLHAQQDKREAEVVSKAGQRIEILEFKTPDAEGVSHKKGQITIVTGIAGRGTDIVLGGPKPVDTNGKLLPEDNPEYIAWKKEHDTINELGGLHITLTEMPTFKRVFLQIIGRAARQGDRGSFDLFVSDKDGIIMNTEVDLLDKLKEEWGLAENITQNEGENIKKQIKINGVLDELQRRAEETQYDRLEKDSEFVVAFMHTKEKFRRYLERVEDPENAHQRILEAIDTTVGNLANTVYAIHLDEGTTKESDEKIEKIIGKYLDFPEDDEDAQIMLNVILRGDKTQVKNALSEYARSTYEDSLSRFETEEEMKDWEKSVATRYIPYYYKTTLQDLTEKLMQFSNMQIQNPVAEFYLAVSNKEREIEADLQDQIAYSAFRW